MTRKVLVTGGAGFIGSHLVRALLEQGFTVRVLDNLSTGSHNNLAEVVQEIDFVQGDLRDRILCLDVCRDVEIVYHLGALGSVPRSVEDPFTTNAVNVDGTLNILAAAEKSAVRRVVFSSSSSVYGDTLVLPKREEMQLNPASPYAASKLAAEAYCRAYHRSFGLDTVVLRYFNVFGPRQNPESQYAAVIPRCISALLHGEPPTIYGDGMQSRDFTYVSNVVSGNLLAGVTPAISGEVFNIACGEQIYVGAVVQEIADLLHVSCEPRFLPARTGDVRDSCADIGKAGERLGYAPVIHFQEGLTKTVTSYLE